MVSTTSPEKAARYIAVCRQKADQLDRLVDDLFAFTKAEYLEQTLRRDRLKLGPVMEQAEGSNVEVPAAFREFTRRVGVCDGAEHTPERSRSTFGSDSTSAM